MRSQVVQVGHQPGASRVPDGGGDDDDGGGGGDDVDNDYDELAGVGSGTCKIYCKIFSNSYKSSEFC